MIAVLAAAMLVGVALPHGMRLADVKPAAAATLWLCSLATRALTGIFVTLWLVFILPATPQFVALTRWCWHSVLPVIATHLGLSGHSVGDLAIMAPVALLAVSVLWVAVATRRATRSVGDAIDRASLGPGPDGTLIVGGQKVVLAVAGLRRPRLLVSAGALVALDDDELAAGVGHERGHIARGHRFVLLAAEICHRLGRLVPGGTRALAELGFHLERDADTWALARDHDRLALASAICKAAQTPVGPASLALAGASRSSDRVRALIENATPPRAAIVPRSASIASVALVLALGVLAPLATASGVSQVRYATVSRCPA